MTPTAQVSSRTRPETGITWISVQRGSNGPIVDVRSIGKSLRWNRWEIREMAIFEGRILGLYGYRVRKSDGVLVGNVTPITATFRYVRSVQ